MEPKDAGYIPPLEEASEAGDLPEGFIRRTYKNAPRAIKRAFRIALFAVTGLRTIITCVMVAATGLMDQFELVDIISWARTVMGDSARVGSVVMILAVLYFCLRLATKGPVKGTKPDIDEGD